MWTVSQNAELKLVWTGLKSSRLNMYNYKLHKGFNRDLFWSPIDNKSDLLSNCTSQSTNNAQIEYKYHAAVRMQDTDGNTPKEALLQGF